MRSPGSAAQRTGSGVSRKGLLRAAAACGVLTLAVVGIQVYQRIGFGDARREHRAREDVVVGAIRQVSLPGLVVSYGPERLDDDELRQGYENSRTPWLAFASCGDACTGWEPGSAVESRMVLEDPRRRTPGELCAALLREVPSLVESGVLKRDRCDLRGESPDGVQIRVEAHYQYYGSSGPVYVEVAGVLPAGR